MKKAGLVLITLFVVFFCGLGELRASHIAGAEITYKRIVGDSFLITVKVFRDCNGITVSVGPVKLFSSCGTRFPSLSLVSTRDITGIPQNCGASRCSGSFTYGFQEIIMQGGVNLAGDTCCDYTLEYSQCCRNTSLTTGMDGSNFAIETKLNRCITNSPPVFSADPIFLTPIGRDFSMTFNARDTIDNDFITYELTNALDGTGSVTYSGQFTPLRPLTFTGFPNTSLSYPAGLLFDTLTGSFSCKPTKSNEATVIAVKVKEWRKINGVMTKIGEITRESQLTIISAPSNRAPVFGDYTTQLISGCPDSGTYCLYIPITDANNSDTVRLKYIHNIPNITFTDTSSANNAPVIKVCYTPDSLARLGLRTPIFTIQASDEVCTLPGRASRTYRLNFNYIPDSFKVNKKLVCKRLDLSVYYPIKTIKQASVAWEIVSNNSTYKKTDSSFSLNLTDTGWHKIKMTVKPTGFCDTMRIKLDSIYVPPANLINVNVDITNDTSTCFNTPITIRSKINNGTAPFVYNWSTTATSDTITPTLVEGNNFFKLSIIDNKGCEASDSMTIKSFYPRVSISGDSIQCINKAATLTATFTGTTSPTYSWAGGYPANQAIIAPIITVNQKFTFILIDSSGCSVSKDYTVNVSDPRVTVSNDTSVCFNPTITIKGTLSSKYGFTSYKWNTGDSMLTSITKKMHTGLNMFKFMAIDRYGCEANDSVIIRAFNPLVTLSGDSIQCKNKNATLTASFTGATAPTYKWTGFANNVATINPIITIPQTFTFVLTDSLGCVVTKTKAVNVSDPKVTVGKDSSVCFNPSVLIKSTVSNSPLPFNYQWSTGDTTANINTPVQTGINTIILTATNKYQCETKDTITIKSFNPQVIISGDSVVCINTNATFTATPVGTIKPSYQWVGYPPNQTTIVEKITTPKQYTFTLIDSFGCIVNKTWPVGASDPTISIGAHNAAYCENDSIKLSASVSGAAKPYVVAWSPFSLSGETITMPPQTPGMVPFKATITDVAGCIDSISDSVLIKPQPSVSITAPGSFCENKGDVVLTNLATPTGGTWSGIGVAGNVFNTINSGPGTFVIKYVYTDSTNGCSNIKTTSVVVQAQPKADFSVDSITAHYSYVFNFFDKSTNSNGQRIWHFGDTNSGINNIDSSKNPTHKFSDTGYYTIKLAVAGGLCPADSIVKTNYIRVHDRNFVGINYSAMQGLKIYPNPTRDYLFIEAETAITTITLTDMLGRNSFVEIQNVSGETKLSVVGLPAGVYYLQATGENGQLYTAKVMVQR